MTQMTTDEKQHFLAGLHVGVLGINRQGRGPLTVPVWYDYRPGGELWFITGKNSIKGKLLSVGERMSLCAQNETMPYQYVSVEGAITRIEPIGDEGLPMAKRYLESSMAEQYAAQMDTTENIVVWLNCEHWLAVDYGKMTH